MLKSLKLLAPVLFPSWRFFDTIAASPRIEVIRLTAADEAVGDWQPFRPRPQKLSYAAILHRLFWNPDWNETLFLTSCAERLLENPTEHSVREISTRIAADLAAEVDRPSFRFRLTLVSREGDALRKEFAYVSPPQAVTPA
jgi:hypothetical protein